jgi:acyl-ACP thioesterase
MEPLHIKEFQISPVSLDRYGRLKISQMLGYLQDVAGEHSALLGTDQNALMDKNLFWAVIRHRVQITRLPGSGEKLRLETWPMPTTRTAYPRSTIAYDEKGNECFRSISLWILMDANTRAMVLPGKSGVEVSGLLRGCELQAPSSLIPKEMGNSQTRTVRYTDLDINGHMNNCRYPDWVLDLLPAAFHGQHEARELTLCYMSEVRENEEVALHWDLSEDGVLTMEAVRNSDQMPTAHSRVFSARVEF